MANGAIATAALSDAATLNTSGTVSGTLPLANLQTMQPGKVCRFTSLTGMAIVADLATAAAIDWIELINHNGTSAATWRIRGATSQANLTAAPGYDSGTVSMWPVTGKPTDAGLKNPASLLHIATAQTFRWWRIDITDAANPDGYWQAGRLIVAKALSPARNWAYGAQFGFVDTSVRHRTPGGQTLPTEGARLKQVAVVFPSLTEDEAFGLVWPMDLARGVTRDVSFYANPAETTHRHRRSVYGLIRDMTPVERLSHPQNSKAWVIEELLP